MDVNAALTAARNALKGIDRGAEMTEELYEAFDAIDGWMSKGGFLPEEWNTHRNVVVRILPGFRNESDLVGELVELAAIPKFDVWGCAKGKLLGSSTYIKKHTDGYVMLLPDEYVIVAN